MTTPKRKRGACVDCPSYHDPCLWSGAGDKPAHLIVIGKNPEWNSIGTGKPFEGHGGRLFRRILDTQIGLLDVKTQIGVYYTYAVLAGAKDPKAAHYKNCLPHLRRELGAIRGIDGHEPVIITVGPDATRSLGLNFEKIEKVTGRRLKTMVRTAKGQSLRYVYPIPSMADMERQDSVIDVVSMVLLAALRLATGQEDKSFIPFDELKKKYRIPKNEKELVELVNHVIRYAGPNASKGPDHWLISLDTETNTLHSFRKDAATQVVSVAWDDQQAAAFLVDHPQAPYSSEVAWREIRRLVGCPKPKVFHNFQYDFKFLDLMGAQTERISWDTQYGEHFLYESKKGYYALKQLAALYYPAYAGYDDELRDIIEELAEKEKEVWEARENKKLKDEYDAALAKFEQALGEHQTEMKIYRAEIKRLKTEGLLDEADKVSKPTRPKKPRAPKKAKWKAPKKGAETDKGFSDVPLDILLPYAAADADVTRLIAKYQIAKAAKTNVRTDAMHVVKNFYIPGARVLSKMEHRGLLIDLKHLEYLTEEVTALRNKAYETLRRDFSPAVLYSSPEKVAGLMAELRFESIDGVTPGSTAEDDLHRYYAHYGPNDERGHFVANFLRFRKANDALNKHLNKKIRDHVMSDGRIHGNYFITGTTTGRSSSGGPNMQNVQKTICRITIQLPGEDVTIENGFNFKKLFIPEPGCRFFNMDISGAELRVYAAYSKDETMIQMLRDGTDVHSYTTFRYYGIPYAEVLAKKHELEMYRLRDKAKRALFAIFYGAGPFRISVVLGCTLEEAKAFIQSCYEAYPGLQPYTEAVYGQILRTGAVRTYIGRRRRFPMARMSGKYMADARREAGNMLIQSTAFDILLGQMIEVDAHADEIGLIPQITVHDSIGGSVAEKTETPQMIEFFDKHVTDRVKEKYSWLPVDFLYELEIGPSYGELEEVA